MIKLSATGKVYKNKDNELCLNTEYTVTLTTTNVTYDNIDAKVAELIADAGQLKAILQSAIIKT